MGHPAREDAAVQAELHPPMASILDALNFRLARIVAMNHRLGQRTMRGNFGLSLTEWRVLGVASALEPAVFHAVCDKLFMDKAQVSRALKVLVARALIAAEPDPEDGRQLVLRLTPAGRALHDRALAVSRARNEADLQDLSPEEVRIFFELLERISKVVEGQVEDDRRRGRRRRA